MNLVIYVTCLDVFNQNQGGVARPTFSPSGAIIGTHPWRPRTDVRVKTISVLSEEEPNSNCLRGKREFILFTLLKSAGLAVAEPLNNLHSLSFQILALFSSVLSSFQLLVMSVGYQQSHMHVFMVSRLIGSQEFMFQ